MTRSTRLEHVVSVDLLDDGTLEVIRLVRSSQRYGDGTPVHPQVFKQIYAAKDDRIEMVSHQAGQYVPPQTIPERYEFQD